MQQRWRSTLKRAEEAPSGPLQAALKVLVQDAESATGTGDLGPGRPVGLALGTPVPALGWALDGTLALQCRKLFGTDGNLALKCQEKAP